MTSTAQHTKIARWLGASLLCVMPLAFPGLFGTSTDLLPKRLLLYVFTFTLTGIWFWQNTAQKSRLDSPLILPATIYIAWNLLSLSWAVNPFSGWIETLQLIALWFLFLWFIQTDLVNNLSFLARGAALGGLIVSLIGIAQYLGIGFANIPSVGLPSSTFVFRNLAAAYLLGCIPFAFLALLASKRNLETALWLFSLSAMLLYLFYTRTRGAWIALAGSALLTVSFILIYPRLREAIANALRIYLSQSALRWGTIACVILIILGGLQPARTSRTVIQQFDEQKATPAAAAASLLSAGSDRGRFAMWRHTIDMIVDHPIRGVGIDNWEFIYPQYDKGDKITGASEPVRPHNDILWIASELGLVGLGIYLYVLARAFLIGLAQMNASAAETRLRALTALMGLSALLIYSLFSFPKEQPASALFFWLCLAILGGLAAKPMQRPPIKIIPVLGIALSLGACYIAIQHIAFDRHYHRARAFETAGRWPDAHREITRALEAGIFDHRAAFLNAQYLQKQGDASAAVAAYQKALVAHPNYAHSHHNLGGAYAALGDQQRAIQAYQRALKLRPTYHQARVNLGNAYVAMGQLDRAITAYQRALKTNPNAAEAHANLGAIYLQRGQFQRAIAALQKAVHLQPENAQIYNNLAYAFEQTGRIPEAIAAYENALKYWRDDDAYRETITSHLRDLRQNRN